VVPADLAEDLLGGGDQATRTGCTPVWINCCPHKEQIEKHLKERLGDLFDLKYDLCLYDITSTYFEGSAWVTRWPSVGYSRQPAGLHAGVYPALW